MDKFEKLLSPLGYGGIELRNHIIFAPTTMGLREKEYIQRIGSIASGGAALVIIGDVPVRKSRFVPSLQTKKGFNLYEKLNEAIHEGGARSCAQLHEDDTVMKGMSKYMWKMVTGKMGMAELMEAMNVEISRMISTMPEEEVHSITSAFADAAELSIKAGFDMVQVHGDRMCGAFSSTVFNVRDDIYGGSVENRARFAVDSVKAIRKRFPSLPIDYKLCMREEDPHYGNAGITLEEAEVFVPLLEKAGVTSFHVTLANHSALENTIPSRQHPYYSEEGCFLKFADKVKSLTDLPVCGVGGLTDPEFMESQLESGRVDAVAMSRALIADPELPNKLRDGKEDTIRRCCRCNRECLGGLMHHRGVGCIYDRKEGKR